MLCVSINTAFLPGVYPIFRCSLKKYMHFHFALLLILFSEGCANAVKRILGKVEGTCHNLRKNMLNECRGRKRSNQHKRKSLKTMHIRITLY